MSKVDIILIGGGGHCRSVIDVIEAEGRFAIAGIVDVKEKRGLKVFGYEIIAADDDIKELAKEHENFVVTVGQIKSSEARRSLYWKLKSLSVTTPTIISPHARVSRYSEIGEGTIVMHHCLVNAGARIGVNCIINSGSIIEHDSTISDHSHISTHATINGECFIGDNTFVGSKSIISNGVKIGSFNIIGAGSVILTDTQANGMYAGNPGVLKKNL